MNTQPTPILQLHQLALYNTGKMTPEQVITAFAARQPLLDRIMSDLSSEKERSRAQQHLVIGQRGMGKTMLLARIAAELSTNRQLSNRFIPLLFAEEQYAVDRLSKFWLNCLDSLADAYELEHRSECVEEIDATVSKLAQIAPVSAKNDNIFADETYEAFAKAAKATGRRPVLLVDNLQIIFHRLENEQQHSLRELLMRPGSPILVGASPSPPPQTSDYAAAFYDQFKMHCLHPLTEGEMRDLLIHLSNVAERDDVRQRILNHPARLKVLRQLTGGNPRTALTLFFLYAEDFAPNVFGDLEGLLDRVTPLYKARFEELTEQQQVITSAIANHWDPVTAAKLAKVTAIPQGSITPQLDRLVKLGTIERVELFGESRKGFQIAERFFNIWFLMRSASRRQRREVEFLTRFLESFYESSDRDELARHLLDADHISSDRYLWHCAVAESLEDPDAAKDLKRHSELLALREEANNARKRLHELIDFNLLQPATLAFNNLRKKLTELVPNNCNISPEVFTKSVLGDRRMFSSEEREVLAARSKRLTENEIKSMLECIDKNRTVDEECYSKEAVACFSKRLASGQIRQLHDADDWNRAFHQASGKECIELMLDSFPASLGPNLDDSSLNNILTISEPTKDAGAPAWCRWGITLDLKLSRFEQAETAYKEAIKRSPQWADLWINLGALLTFHLKRYKEAESCYRKAIARAPQSGVPWFYLGNLLHYCLARYSEAELCYLKATDLEPKHSPSWKSLGDLLHHRLKRYDESEICYRTAIKFNKGNVLLWHDLGDLFQNHLHQYDKAEEAYRKAIEFDPNNEATWNSLGNLFCDFMNRLPEAATAYETAIKIEPASTCAQHNLLYLHRDFMGEGPAARPLVNELALLEHDDSGTTYLHEALFSAYEDNWGLACEALTKALALRENGVSACNNSDDWLRASAVLLHLNYGSDFLKFLDEQGLNVRLRPWVEAIRALHIGNRLALQNVAPEIRSSAEELYDGINHRLKQLPQSTNRRPTPKPKRSSKARK